MAMTRPEIELRIPKQHLNEKMVYHMNQGAFKIECVKNADNLTWDLTAWYILDQRNQGFDR